MQCRLSLCKIILITLIFNTVFLRAMYAMQSASMITTEGQESNFLAKYQKELY